MRIILLKPLSITVFLFLFLGFSFTEGNNRESRKEKIGKKYYKTKEHLNKSEGLRRQILSRLYDLNKNMKKVEKEKTNLKKNQLSVKIRINDLKRKIWNKENEVLEQKKRIRRKMNLIYRLGGSGYFGVFFSDMTISEREINLKILSNLTHLDLKLIKHYQKNLAILERNRAVLVKQGIYLKKIVSQLRGKEGSLKKVFYKKTVLIRQLKKERKIQLKKLFKLRHRAENRYIENLLKPSIYERKGNLNWPIKGIVLRESGFIKTEGVVLNHKGVFFLAPRGTAVKSIFQGKVSYTGVRPGYGKLVIVDHGDHYYSIYAHNNKIRVRVGQEVKAQDVLATSGESKNFILNKLEEGLYFEIRHFSEANDPLVWLKKKNRLHISSSRLEGESL